MDNEYVMYLIVNNDLSMGKGKICAQVGHAVQYIIDEYYNGTIGDKKSYQLWKENGNPKIIIKASQEELNKLSKYKNTYTIIDAGRTQIAPNSMTVVVFFPTQRKNLEFLKNFKLL